MQIGTGAGARLNGPRYRASVRIKAPGRLAIVSFRLGGQDGVSIEAAKWAWALGRDRL